MTQNKKLQISLIGITLLLLIFWNINDKQESNVIEIELNKATNLDTDITSDLSVINITAKTNKETEIIASDFYDDIFFDCWFRRWNYGQCRIWTIYQR
jgi:hypothetical protein